RRGWRRETWTSSSSTRPSPARPPTASRSLDWTRRRSTPREGRLLSGTLWGARAAAKWRPYCTSSAARGGASGWCRCASGREWEPPRFWRRLIRG
ncbi:unnamed protein product, partial [Ascophyllum nodosum]